MWYIPSLKNEVKALENSNSHLKFYLSIQTKKHYFYVKHIQRAQYPTSSNTLILCQIYDNFTKPVVITKMSLCSVILSLIKILLKKMMLLLQLTTTAYDTKLSWFSFDSKNLFQVIYDLLRSNSGPANHRHLVILQLLLNDDADLKIRIKTWCIGSFYSCLFL